MVTKVTVYPAGTGRDDSMADEDGEPPKPTLETQAPVGEAEDAAANGEGSAAPEEDAATAAHPPGEQQESTAMDDVHLTPLDAAADKQNLKDAVDSGGIPPPPIKPAADGSGSEEMAASAGSLLHADEAAPQDRPADPPKGGDGLGAGPVVRGRKRNKLMATAGGGKGHSNPRKTPYKSEIGRLRHERQVAAANGTNGGPPRAKPLGLSLAETNAPPPEASFAISASRFKHDFLHGLGEFLTSAFADDEEASGSYFSQDLLDQLAESSPHLRGVWLQAKSLNDVNVRDLCHALIRNRVVTEVWLPGNHITDVGASYIAHMLKFNRTIKVRYARPICSSTSQPRASELTFSSLTHCRKIQHTQELFLGENDIGPKGAAALASALARNNNTLQALGLGNNHIGVEGAGAFAAALRHNHTLHTLDVKDNGIPRRSSIRALLSKMLEFNASDPGDESLVLGLQDELAKLVSSLPPDVAEAVVMQAEEALKQAMTCRRRGDKVGAAEAEGVFIRVCTTGERPRDPPSTAELNMEPVEEEGEEMRGKGKSVKRADARKLEPESGLDGIQEELGELKFEEKEEGGGDPDKEPLEAAAEEVAKDAKEEGADEPAAEAAESSEAASEDAE